MTIKRVKFPTVEELQQEKRRRDQLALTAGHDQLIQALADLVVAAHLNEDKSKPKKELTDE
jgi:hypothetical protein